MIKGKMTEVKRSGYIVSFWKGIRALLLPEVATAVRNPHYSCSTMMKDVCDGSFVQSHPLFVKEPNALQIILNYDDMEIVNPLRTHVKKTNKTN